MAETRTAVARRRGRYAHEVEINGRHTIVSDEPAYQGGDDKGSPPTSLLAASLAACTAITVEMYAERKGWDLGELEVEARMTVDDNRPQHFDLGLNLPDGLDAQQVERLVVIAGKCPVHRSLSPDIGVEIVPGSLGVD